MHEDQNAVGCATTASPSRWRARSASTDGVRIDPSGLIVFLAGTPWDGFRGSDQHIAERLARYRSVLYVDPPTSVMTPWRERAILEVVRQPRLRGIRSSLHRLTTYVPPYPERGILSHVTRTLVDRSIAHAVRALGGVASTVVHAGPRLGLDAWDEVQRFVYATDDFAAGAELMGVPEARLRQAETTLAERCDGVITVSAQLQRLWADRGCRTWLIPNGVDIDPFSRTDEVPAASDVDLPRPIAGFFGHLSERIDLSLLEAVSERGHSLLLVGPRQPTFALERMKHLLARDNVEWVGPRPFDTLPSYLKVMDVGLVPYADTAFNRASFPLKTLEYLAGGRSVVSTDLPAIRWLGTPLIVRASSPTSFAEAVEAALRAPQTGEIRAHRRSFTRPHSWDNRAEEFAAALGVLGAPGSTRPGADEQRCAT